MKLQKGLKIELKCEDSSTHPTKINNPDKPSGNEIQRARCSCRSMHVTDQFR